MKRLLIALLLVACATCGGDGDDEATPTDAPETSPTPPASAVVTPPASPLSTPKCTSGGKFTPQSTEGPYFKAGSPEKRNLYSDVDDGTKLMLTGYILSTDCVPLVRAKLDFWQADAQGVYDNQGYRLRGHQFTDERGRYRLQTVVPGEYPGRTGHIHVTITPPVGTPLTTQLYLPNDTNDEDVIFNEELLIKVGDRDPGEISGSFDFVLVIA